MNNKDLNSKTKIIWIDRDIAFTLTDSKGNKTLYLNKSLKAHPGLLKRILAHELKHIHSNKPMDFIHDFKDAFIFTLDKDLISFIIKHPKSISSISPFWVIKIGKGKEACYSVTINWFQLLSIIGFATLIFIIITLL